MRTTFFIIVMCMTQVFAGNSFSQNSRLSINLKNVTTKTVLSQIEDESQYYFIYDATVVNVDKRVSIQIENEPINRILDELFDGTNIIYKINDRQIALSSRSVATVAQQIPKITGRVVDSSGTPLPGVTVVIKGTTTGTITDSDGNYSLNKVPADATLQFSFVGMKTQEIAVAGKNVINVKMAEETVGLEEVVAVGYGVQKKSNVTGAIVSVNTNDLQNRTTQDVGHSVQGKVAGVQVLATSGAPDAKTAFRIRGYSSTGSSDPLYIVDGLKVSDISYLDQESIASIEILKDAASAAIYGAEAGNGVVLITTKKGKAGTTKIFYNAQLAISSEANPMKMMNASQFKDYWTTAGLADPTSFGNANTNWQKVIFGNGLMQRHTLGVEGSNDKGSLYMSMSYLDNNGMVVGNKDLNKRFTSQVNASYKLKPWLTVGMTNSIERGQSSGISENNFTGTGSAIGGAYYYDPTVPTVYQNDSDAPSYLLNAEAQGYNVFRRDGKLYGASALMQSNLWNPLGMIDYLDNNNWRTNINGTFYGDFKPIKGLTITSRLGYRIDNTYNTVYQHPYYWNPNQISAAGTFQSTINHSFYYQWENFGNYLFSLGKNDFTIMAGMQFTRDNTEYQFGSTNKLFSEAKNYRYLDYSSPDANDVVGGHININSSISYFGRLGWSYDNRYTLQGILRGDAFDLSKLSQQNRWGVFPSVSAGWTISNENFMKSINPNFLSSLKLRASWGINGNISSLSNYPYTSSLSLGNTGALFYDSYYSLSNTSGLITGAYPSDVLPNPNLSWEQSKQTDVGLDSRFLNDRMSLSVDYFNKNTTHMLSTISAPAISGTTTQTINAGKINNSGLEFDLTWKDKVGKLNYNVEANFSTIHNKVIESPYGSTGRQPGGTNFFLPVTYFEKGYPVWYIRTYIHDHIDPKTGLPVYKTAEELGTDDGKDYAGSGIPKYTYGLTISLDYKGIDFKVFGTGTHGNKNFLAVYRPDIPQANLPEIVYTERWTPTNTNVKFPAPNHSDPLYAQSDFWVFDASYFKIKEIQLGYTFPSALIKKAMISSLRTYVSLSNFFTFTKYPGNDPESMSSTSGGAMQAFAPGFGVGQTIGVDRVNYPSMKSVVFGINLSF